MWSKPIGEIVVLSLVVVSILISGCTVISPSTSTPSPTSSPTVTTPTLTPSTDYSSELTKYYEAGTAIMERPFTKSINERGNDVYKGVGRNATMPGAGSVTIVVEFTKSQAEAKAV